MTQELTDVLDSAVARLQTGQTPPEILADQPAHARALAPLLETAQTLDTLRVTQIPAADQIQADRDAFLQSVWNLQQQPVSAGPLERLNAWMVHTLPRVSFNGTMHRKERRMTGLLLKFMLVFGVITGSTGGAAVMAANSVPGSPLYPLKMSMEQARFALADSAAEQAQMHMLLAHERSHEMTRLAQSGSTPDAGLLNRLRAHTQTALQLAAGLPDNEMNGLLKQFQQMAYRETEALNQARQQSGEAAQEPLRAAEQMMRQIHQDVSAGLEEPLAFRSRYGANRPADLPDPPAPEPGAGNEESPGPKSPTPDVISDTVDIPPMGKQVQEQHRNRECEGDNCEPAGDANRHGQTDEAPPHGDQDCADCEPEGDQNKYGQSGEEPPHGDRDCTGCESEGEQNKVGQPGEEPPHGDQDCPDCTPPGGENQHQNGQDTEIPVEQAPDPAPAPNPEPKPSPPQDNGGSSDHGGSSGGGSSSGGGNSGGGSGGGKK